MPPDTETGWRRLRRAFIKVSPDPPIPHDKHPSARFNAGLPLFRRNNFLHAETTGFNTNLTSWTIPLLWRRNSSLKHRELLPSSSPPSLVFSLGEEPVCVVGAPSTSNTTVAGRTVPQSKPTSINLLCRPKPSSKSKLTELGYLGMPIGAVLFMLWARMCFDSFAFALCVRWSLVTQSWSWWCNFVLVMSCSLLTCCSGIQTGRLGRAEMDY
jgi:hypothetical protein